MTAAVNVGRLLDDETYDSYTARVGCCGRDIRLAAVGCTTAVDERLAAAVDETKT